MSSMTTASPPPYLADYADIYASDPRAAAKRWFTEARYGLFIHFGLYSILGRHEWVQYRDCIRPAEYAELARYFRAERFDAEAVADLAVASGMRYINLTMRHHDSFCLFDSRHTTFNSVRGAPAGRDLAAELAAACEKRSLGLCFYYSHGRDWKHPHAPNNDEYGGKARPPYESPELTYAAGPAHDLDQYLDFMTAQITELLTGYGPIAAIWLDGIATPLNPRSADGQPRTDYEPTRDGDPFRCQELYDHIHSLQPQCLVAYKQGYLGTEDFFAPEHKAYNRFGESFDAERPGEICTTLTTSPNSWGYFAGDEATRRSADEVWHMLATARQNQCNLLLNVGPDGTGAVPEHEQRVLRDVGERLRQEGFPQQMA